MIRAIIETGPRTHDSARVADAARNIIDPVNMKGSNMVPLWPHLINATPTRQRERTHAIAKAIPIVAAIILAIEFIRFALEFAQ